MEPTHPRGSRESSREASPRSTSVKGRAEERPIRPLVKAFPPMYSDLSPPRAPSVASGLQEKTTKGKYQVIPSMPPPPQLPTTPSRDVTPRLRHPPSTSEEEREGWNPLVTTMWAQFPDETGPVFGWFREGAVPFLDTFFGSDGSFRNLTKDALMQYALSDIASPERARPPGGIILHHTLHHQIQEALKTRDFLKDPHATTSFPIATEKDWRRVALPGSSLSLDFHFPCATCGVLRVVRRSESTLVNTFPSSYEFHCRDVGLDCAVFTTMPTTFLSRTAPTHGNDVISPAHVTKPPRADLPLPSSTVDLIHEDGWRKRMKFWAGITTYMMGVPP